MDNQAEPKTTAKPVIVQQALNQPEKNTVPSSVPGKRLGLAALLIAITAAASSGYLWQVGTQQLQLQQQGLQKTQANVAGAIQRVGARATESRALQRQLDRQANMARQQQQQLEKQIENLQQQLASQQKRLLSLSTTDRDDWLLAEAEYLMRLANQRLLMGKEIKGARQLLKAADNILLELDGSGLYSVRQALAENIAALRAAGRFDLEGIYLQLGAAANQADQLRLIEMPQLEIASMEPQQPESWQQRLEFGLHVAWKKLSHYIQIKRRDTIYQPQLAPDYAAAVRQNIRLMFEQAQMGSLSGRQRVYEASLAKAKSGLSHYYTLDQEATAVVIAMIDELAEQQVEVSLPDISGSLRALKNYLDTIHNVKPLASHNIKPLTSDKAKPLASDKAKSLVNKQSAAAEEPAQ
ncbi:MAG: uroporphyrinogen-III C-methyltransferase [Pseudomonadales bacterium]